MKKYYTIGVVVIILLVTIGIGRHLNAPAVSTTNTPTATLFTIRVGYSASNFNHSPTIIALETGIFQKNELNVVPVLLKSGNEIQQAMIANQIDIGVTGSTNFFAPISKGAPIKFIMPIVSLPSTIYVNKESNIKALADLRGKRIGIAPGASSSMLLLLTVLNHENINKDDITLVNIEKNIMPMVLTQKKEIDAAILVNSEKPVFDKVGAVELQSWKDSIYPQQAYTRNVAAVNTDFLAQNENAVRYFVQSMIDAEKYIKENNEKSAGLISQHMQKVAGVPDMTTEKVQKAFKDINLMLWEDPQNLQKIADTSFAVGELKTKLTLDQMFDQRFAPMLEKAQQEIYGTTAQK